MNNVEGGRSILKNDTISGKSRDEANAVSVVVVCYYLSVGASADTLHWIVFTCE